MGLVVVVGELGDWGDRVLISGFGDRGDPSNPMEDCWLIAWRIVGIPSHLGHASIIFYEGNIAHI